MKDVRLGDASDRLAYRFNANRFTLCSVEIICTPRQFFEIHVFVRVHLSTVNLHDACTSLGDRRGNVNEVKPINGRRTVSFGCGNSILRSNRPDRRSAGSRMSTRFVAAITLKDRFDAILSLD